jgi:hypothetical protein
MRDHPLAVLNQNGAGVRMSPGSLSPPLVVGYPVTQPYQRWLGVAPSSRYAIFMRVR